jgi:kynurenine 3-monooxygenase
MAEPITIVGGGCTGPLMALMLARRGYPVELFERRPDVRHTQVSAGRSINLALAARGLVALQHAGVFEQVAPLLMPMRGREIHEVDGATRFMPYSQHPDEMIWSVERTALNRTLTLAAEARGATFHFQHALTHIDIASGHLDFENQATGQMIRRPMDRLIAADGANSSIRRAMIHAGLTDMSEDVLPHRYKELTIPPGPSGAHPLRADALHVWPRGGYMLIALPNPDGSFTATLFMAAKDEQASFEQLDSADTIDRFFRTQFPDAHALMPALTREFQTHPTGTMSTVRVGRWHVDGRVLLIGDAAHAIVPFHGQGMNCGFEDCRVLDALLADTADLNDCFARFAALRQDNTDAIARMALENYIEMRDTVRDPRFALKQALAVALAHRRAEQFIPRYSMVSFRPDIPYAVAEHRGQLQHQLIEQALFGHDTLQSVDWAATEASIDRLLPPISAA